jgi:succinate-acetate transporter protein
MALLEHWTIWTYLEIVVYVSLYRKLFAILAKNVNHPLFLQRWSLSPGTAVGIANLMVSGMFGLCASASGFYILWSALKPDENGLLSSCQS